MYHPASVKDMPFKKSKIFTLSLQLNTLCAFLALEDYHLLLGRHIFTKLGAGKQITEQFKHN
jgi:hypothetical protein